jgi:hypothetical protein
LYAHVKPPLFPIATTLDAPYEGCEWPTIRFPPVAAQSHPARCEHSDWRQVR